MLFSHLLRFLFSPFLLLLILILSSSFSPSTVTFISSAPPSPLPSPTAPITNYLPIWCAVCDTLVNLVSDGINETKDNHDIQVRFRIDDKKKIPYSRSEFRLMEIVDTEIEKMLEGRNIGIFNDTKIPQNTLLPHHSLLQTRIVQLPETPSVPSQWKDVYYGPTISSVMKKMMGKITETFYDSLILSFHRTVNNQFNDDTIRGIKQQFCIKQAKCCVEGTDFDIPFPELEETAEWIMEKGKRHRIDENGLEIIDEKKEL